MTTSNYLIKYQKYAQEHNFGPIEDHYFIDGHTEECHPDFAAFPIGHPMGKTVCKRVFRTEPQMKSATRARTLLPMDSIKKKNHYETLSYTMMDGLHVQVDNPISVNQRGLVNEMELRSKDYIYRDKYYDGIGMGTSRQGDRIRWRMD